MAKSTAPHPVQLIETNDAKSPTHRERKAELAWRVFLGSMLMLMGLVQVHARLGDLIEKRRLASWASVEGAVIESSLGDNSLYAMLKIEYAVDGEQFVYERTIAGDPADKDRLVDAYPLDAVAKVYINPEVPEDSLLADEIEFAGYIPLVCFLGFVLLGCCLWQ